MNEPKKKEELTRSAKLNIELPEEAAEGIYSNLAMIAHSNSEFVVDFIRLMPGLPKARVKARVILSPTHAKQLLHALQDNVKKYERAFGTIQDTDERPPYPFAIGAGPIGEA